MDLTNIEGIERLECITVFTVVASKLSSNLRLFCTQLCKGKKKNWKCDSEDSKNVQVPNESWLPAGRSNHWAMAIRGEQGCLTWF